MTNKCREEFEEWIFKNEDYLLSLNKFEAVKAAFKKGYNIHNPKFKEQEIQRLREALDKLEILRHAIRAEHYHHKPSFITLKKIEEDMEEIIKQALQ